MYEYHVYYIKNYIQNFFKVGIIEFAECVHEMFELAKFLHPLIRKNKQYHKAAWYNRDIPHKEEIIIKAIGGDLPTAIHEEVDNRDINLRRIPPEEFIDLLRTLEAKYNRRNADHETNDPSLQE